MRQRLSSDTVSTVQDVMLCKLYSTEDRWSFDTGSDFRHKSFELLFSTRQIIIQKTSNHTNYLKYILLSNPFWNHRGHISYQSSSRLADLDAWNSWWPVHDFFSCSQKQLKSRLSLKLFQIDFFSFSRLLITKSHTKGQSCAKSKSRWKPAGLEKNTHYREEG